MKKHRIVVININGKTNEQIENIINQTGGEVQCVADQNVYIKVPTVVEKVQKTKTKKKQY